jgi:hypothetical protein
MRSTLSAGLLLSCVAALVATLSTADNVGGAQAPGMGAWEYAYLVEVDRIDTFEGGVEAWAAGREDKAYLRAHVFAYEKGFSANDLTLNRLRRMNALAEEGWALYDVSSGLLVRRR